MHLVNFAPSSNIDLIRYDGAKQELLVCFKSGSNYLYRGVDRETAEEISHAPSAGKYLSRNVQQRCDAIPVDRDGHPV